MFPETFVPDQTPPVGEPPERVTVPELSQTAVKAFKLTDGAVFTVISLDAE